VLHPSSVFKLDMPPTLQATILRDREVVRLTLTTFPTEKIETSRVILFCGAVIQQPYLAVRQSVGTLHSDVYVAACLPGSPFTRYEGKTGAFITHINGMSTPTLDSFLNEVNKIEDNTYFRLTCMNTQNIQFVKTLKRDEHYFPLIEYLRDHDERSGWKIMKV
jgi:C-terminal processing protease CtpA/Prc